MDYLELFHQHCEDAKMPEHERRKLSTLLRQIGEKNLDKGEHSVRVGIQTKEIADILGLDPCVGLYATFHDAGILKIDKRILEAEELDPDQQAEMDKHVLYGQRILKKLGFGFASEYALRHHLHQVRSYPDPVPPIPAEYTETSRLDLELYLPIVYISDQLDAQKRKNKRSESSNGKSPVQKLLDNSKPIHHPTIRKLAAIAILPKPRIANLTNQHA